MDPPRTPVTPGVGVVTAMDLASADFLLEDPDTLAGRPLLSSGGGSEDSAGWAQDDMIEATRTGDFDARRKTSLKLVYLTNFLSATGFSLLLSTIFQYLDDETGKQVAKDFMGFVIGAFSVGQIIGAPLWGYLTTKTSYLNTFLYSISARLLGNVLYALVHSIEGTEAKKWTMLVSRVMVGFGAGSMAVCNAYVAAATTMEERTGAMGLVAASGGLGFIIGPLMSIMFGGIEGNKSDAVLLNYETLPAYLAVVLCIINMFLLKTRFVECRVETGTKLVPLGGAILIENTARTENSSGQNLSKSVSAPNDGEEDDDALLGLGDAPEQSRQKRRYTAIAALLGVYFLVYVCLSLSETVSVPLAITEFSWSKQKADVDIGVITGLLGVEVVVVFILAKPLAMKYGERRVLMGGLLVVVIGMLVSVPLGGDPLVIKGSQDNATLAPDFGPPPEDMLARSAVNVNTWQYRYDVPLWFQLGADAARDADATNATACDYSWCSTVPKLPFWQFMLSAIIVNASWPLANVMIFGLYSKVWAR